MSGEREEESWECRLAGLEMMSREGEVYRIGMLIWVGLRVRLEVEVGG